MQQSRQLTVKIEAY